MQVAASENHETASNLIQEGAVDNNGLVHTTPSILPHFSKPMHYHNHTVYDSSNFFDGFIFETSDDATHGTVDYVSREEATTYELINNKDGKIYIGVDNTTIVDKSVRGRKSIRITSKRVLNGNNLVLLDLDHMPSTVGDVVPKGCSVWPAFWSVSTELTS